jgi:hypothetical protein
MVYDLLAAPTVLKVFRLQLMIIIMCMSFQDFFLKGLIWLGIGPVRIKNN